MTDRPAWLKRMENGALGEARARAFLLERFWVLERSVDIQGVDFLIQRKLTNANFMDTDPPRLGIIQVKFIQDGRTTITIPSAYVLDAKGAPHAEFFALVCTGAEDDPKMFLLSAKDIAVIFRLNEDGDYVVAGAAILASPAYAVGLRSKALDQIDHALKNADFRANRRFLLSGRYIKLGKEQIDFDYTLPVFNGWGSIPDEFYAEKRKLQSTQFEMEEAIEVMDKIVHETDPARALELFDEGLAPYIGRGGSYSASISFTCEAFGDWDFGETVRRHKSRIEGLRAAGIENGYFSLLKAFEDALVVQIPALVAEGAHAVEIRAVYDPSRLDNPNFEVMAVDKLAVLDPVAPLAKGRQMTRVDLTEVFDEAHFEPGSDLAGVLRKRMWRLRLPFLTGLHHLYLGEPEEGV